MLVLIFLLLFATVSLVAWEVIRPKPDPIARRVLGASAVPTTRERRLEGSFGRRVIAPAVTGLGQKLARVLPQNVVRKIDQLLLQADEPWSLAGFLSVWAVSSVGGVLLFIYVALVSSATPTQLLGLGVAFIPFPVLIPYAVLRRKAMNRRNQITRALPDALDLLTTSVEAGMAIDAAFAMIVEKTSGALSELFALYMRQVGLGRGRKDALLFVAERSGVSDLTTLAAAINQGEELGTTLGDVLRVQAADLRILRRQRAQEAAQRAPVLMTIPMTLCFLPAMVAVIVVPSILNLIDFLDR